MTRAPAWRRRPRRRERKAADYRRSDSRQAADQDCQWVTSITMAGPSGGGRRTAGSGPPGPRRPARGRRSPGAATRRARTGGPTRAPPSRRRRSGRRAAEAVPGPPHVGQAGQLDRLLRLPVDRGHEPVGRREGEHAGDEVGRAVGPEGPERGHPRRRRSGPGPRRRSGRCRRLRLGLGPGLLRQAEHPLAHDVALDLGRAAPDRLGPGEEERRLQRARPGSRRGPGPCRRPGIDSSSGEAPVRIWPSIPRMSMASSMMSRWYSDQNILLVAPRATTPGSFAGAAPSDSERQPLTFMIWTLVQARASRWRITGSAMPPVLPRPARRSASSSRSKRR